MHRAATSLSVSTPANCPLLGQKSVQGQLSDWEPWRLRQCQDRMKKHHLHWTSSQRLRRLGSPALRQRSSATSVVRISQWQPFLSKCPHHTSGKQLFRTACEPLRSGDGRSARPDNARTASSLKHPGQPQMADKQRLSLPPLHLKGP